MVRQARSRTHLFIEVLTCLDITYRFEAKDLQQGVVFSFGEVGAKHLQHIDDVPTISRRSGPSVSG